MQGHYCQGQDVFLLLPLELLNLRAACTHLQPRALTGAPEAATVYKDISSPRPTPPYVITAVALSNRPGAAAGPAPRSAALPHS